VVNHAKLFRELKLRQRLAFISPIVTTLHRPTKICR